jgi:hypothetical protein
MDAYIIVGEFTDMHTGQKYMPDDVVEFTKKRAEEILRVGNLIRKSKPPKSSKEVPTSKQTII